ncbi:hypothetical protein [Komagataeibacter kakiaceti]|uniref:hypothetical protein n=1 Tax=Komagataeibacter kakiaceti TaxID=943261 RepID=UPI000470DC24|nr:hypothetical protein [Komagataeibacter kakiaceti]
MEINAGNINALTTRINVAFNRRLSVVAPTYQKFSMVIPSTSGPTSTRVWRNCRGCVNGRDRASSTA